MSKWPRGAKRLPLRDATTFAGLMMTPRLGDQWLRWWLDADDHRVVLLDAVGKPFGTATVVTAMYMPLAEVPAHVLLLNQSAAGRTHVGAMDQLSIGNPHESVTLLFFYKD